MAGSGRFYVSPAILPKGYQPYLLIHVPMDDFGFRKNGYSRMANGMWCKEVEFPGDRTESDRRNAYKEIIVRRSDGSIFTVLRNRKLSQPNHQHANQ